MSYRPSNRLGWRNRYHSFNDMILINYIDFQFFTMLLLVLLLNVAIPIFDVKPMQGW